MELSYNIDKLIHTESRKQIQYKELNTGIIKELADFLKMVLREHNWVKERYMYSEIIDTKYIYNQKCNTAEPQHSPKWVSKPNSWIAFLPLHLFTILY